MIELSCLNSNTDCIELAEMRISFFFFVVFTAYPSNAILPMFLHQRLPEPLPPLSFLLMQHYLSRNVNIQNTIFLGRSALKVSYTNDYQKFIDDDGWSQGNGYVELPLTTFYEGTIDVDIAAERNNKRTKDPERPGAAGVAFRIQSDNDKYELVYLRTTNGRFNLPSPSIDRLGRAIQYASPPEWTSAKLRNQFPGQYEAGAKIGERRWNHLRISVRNNTLTVFVDGQSAIQRNLLGLNARGSFAYWVDAGTNAYFTNLRIVEA